MVRAADLQPTDRVLEIGPGLGILTERLVRAGADVVAVELDAKLAESLPERLGEPPNLRVVHADALHVDLSELLAEPYVVVASLPYHVATPILFKLLFAAPRPARIVAMLQKEVALRIAGRGSATTYLETAFSLVATVRLVREVPPGAFYPPPKIRSAIVRLDRRAEPVVQVGDVGSFVRFLRAGFAQPRKQLHNSLGEGLHRPASDVQRISHEAGIDSTRRPGDLRLEQWAALYARMPPGEGD